MARLTIYATFTRARLARMSQIERPITIQNAVTSYLRGRIPVREFPAYNSCLPTNSSAVCGIRSTTYGSDDVTGVCLQIGHSLGDMFNSYRRALNSSEPPHMS